MKRLLLVFVISASHIPVVSIYIRHNRAAVSRCDDSLKSVQKGFRCPSNKAEWEERAKEMKCETFTQNCTEENNFVYHCLINAWPNGTIEVCAPVIPIPGSFCAEFSIGGARIQAHYRSECKSCPYIYNSSESYKYQECYELVKPPEMSTKPEISETVSYTKSGIFYTGKNQNASNTTDKENEYGRAVQTEVTMAVILISCVIIIVIILSLLFLVVSRHFQRYRQQNSSETKCMTAILELPTDDLIPVEQEKSDADKKKTTDINQLKINEDLVEYLCKIEGKNPDSLKEKLFQSPYYKKYENSLPKPNHQQIEVTGDFQEDIGIQAAAEILNIKIYIVVWMQNGEKTVVCFDPKDPDAVKWIKISVDKKRKYKHLSDYVTCNEEAASLTYDYVFEWQVEEADKKTTDTNQLKINEDLIELLCKIENEKPHSLKERILHSPYFIKYENSLPKPNHQQIDVTGDFQEDIGIQAVADILNIKIYTVVWMQNGEKPVVCFDPKDPDAVKWIKISVDKKKKYKHLSDWVTCNEEAASLTYDYVFDWQVEEDGKEILSKEETPE